MKNFIFILISLLVAVSCSERKADLSWTDFYTTDLFKEVQINRVFEDGKTFVDCAAKRPLIDILSDYEENKNKADFDLRAFVNDNFELPIEQNSQFVSDTSKNMVEHINSLWPILQRKSDDYNPLSSLIPLPNSYIVPGGRFREIYYWDSYFTIEGLMEAGQEAMAINMLNNFSFLIDSIGFIPNGNRAYYLGRSQPPFYSLILSRVASEDRDLFIQHLPHLLKEYHFWMKGEESLTQAGSSARVVRLTDGTILNRYWDDFEGPRPESFREDYELVVSNNLDRNTTFKHLRAGAESGWDYSSRWFADAKEMKTIETTNIIPIDLNALIYHLELKIAQGYNWKGQLDSTAYYLNKAEKRKAAINKYLWDDQAQFYVDYNFVKNKSTGVHSLAAAYALYFKIASKAQAKATIERLLSDFLKQGGFVTTLNNTGQQWDYPNGWAPLQWITVNGLFNYGFHDQGMDALGRWVARNREVYEATGKMVEKYNVVDTTLEAGGGEYPLQDGFGWSNGIAIAFDAIQARKPAEE